MSLISLSLGKAFSVQGLFSYPQRALCHGPRLPSWPCWSCWELEGWGEGGTEEMYHRAWQWVVVVVVRSWR